MGDVNKYRQLREQHVIRFLTQNGPVTMAELRTAIPGTIGGDAVLCANRLMREGRLDRSFVSDIDQLVLPC